MRWLVAVVALALFGALWGFGITQAQTYEQVCQDTISHLDQYSRYSLSFDKREWGAIYTKTNPNRNAGLYTTYRISGTPTDRLSAACYTKPDERTLALIEVFTPPKNLLWCNYSRLGKWESGGCNWQEWPLFHAFGSITPSRVTETAEARERVKNLAPTQPQPQAQATFPWNNYEAHQTEQWRNAFLQCVKWGLRELDTQARMSQHAQTEAESEWFRGTMASLSDNLRSLCEKDPYHVNVLLSPNGGGVMKLITPDGRPVELGPNGEPIIR
jgi:hypothetical protein